MEEFDYAASGMEIQYAMLDHHKRFPDKSLRPDYILWGGKNVKIYDWWTVPQNGRIKIELIEAKGEVEQAADVKIEDGHLTLIDGTEVPLLRTWADSRYENVIEYPYFSKAGRLCVNNVFKRVFPNGIVREDKDGNRGFWVEDVSPLDRIYHCSHGMVSVPDFSLFRFRVTVSE